MKIRIAVVVDAEGNVCAYSEPGMNDEAKLAYADGGVPMAVIGRYFIEAELPSPQPIPTIEGKVEEAKP